MKDSSFLSVHLLHPPELFLPRWLYHEQTSSPCGCGQLPELISNAGPLLRSLRKTGKRWSEAEGQTDIDLLISLSERGHPVLSISPKPVSAWCMGPQGDIQHVAQHTWLKAELVILSELSAWFSECSQVICFNIPGCCQTSIPR